jgi:hypothetical protein
VVFVVMCVRVCAWVVGGGGGGGGGRGNWCGDVCVCVCDGVMYMYRSPDGKMEGSASVQLTTP